MAYSFLEPIQVGPFTLKNRILKQAMAEHLCHEDGSVSDRFIDFYRTMAQGGVALIVPGIPVLDDRVTDPPIMKAQRGVYLTDEKYLPGLKKAVDAIHKAGSLIMFQLWQSGIAQTPQGGKSIVTDLTKEEIHILRDKFVAAAGLVKAAGADGVEFHMAHTYFASQMFSPYFNKRTDEYGADTIENATRFARECLEQINERYCDDTFTIIVKLNGNDFLQGGITPHWAGQAAAILEKAGAKLFTVNGGGSLAGARGAEYMSDGGHNPEGWKVHFAETVKQYVTVPVAASGNIRHPDYAHHLIREGVCDMIGLGRALLAEPEWVNKCAEGREDELRHCISCNYCFGGVPEDGSVPGCSVNPYYKCEAVRPELVKDGDGRTVVVVGAGPAGLEAAVVLAQRGFRPVILERRRYLGGLVDMASTPPHKRKLRWLIEYYDRRLRRLGVEVHLSTEATPDAIAALDPYAVLLATGSIETVPTDIPGITGSNVWTARELLERLPRIVGQDVVVVGGGLTGIETAHLLTLKGNRVTVVEATAPPTRTLAEMFRWRDAQSEGVTALFEHSLLEIQSGAVLVKNEQTNETTELAADTVVLAMGSHPEQTLYETVKDRFARVCLIGDSAASGSIPTAIRSGAEAAYRLV